MLLTARPHGNVLRPPYLPGGERKIMPRCGTQFAT